MHIPLVQPSSILIAGPSGSGKTVFVRKLILERMIHPFPTRIVFIFSEWQKEYDIMKKMHPTIEFIKGPMPENLYEQFSPMQTNLLVLDDQMIDGSKSTQLEKYFVQGSHHKNLTIIFIVQNIFEKGKVMRTSNLNSHYIVIYKNPRDKGQMAILGRQMFPTKWREFLEAARDATLQPYSYLLIDLRPETPEEYRLRTHIFPSESADALPTDVYIIP